MFPREHELFVIMFEIGNQRTVDGRDPAPPWMVQTCSNPRNNENHLPTGSWGDGEVYQLQDFATIRRIYFTGNLTGCY
jgi:hypothetical protein